jgi:hypothetical protein
MAEKLLTTCKQLLTKNLTNLKGNRHASYRN